MVGPVDEYIKNTLPLFESFSPPESVVYILYYKKHIAGMGSIKRTSDEFSEIKRMYVKPKFRGKGIGRALMTKLLDTASEFGINKLRLDTGPFMKSAQKIYRKAGFYEIDKYPGAEGPENLEFNWIYMEKILG
jgi:GNAT superfamily N-acetyltransferase